MPLNPAICNHLGTNEETLMRDIHSDVKEIFSSMLGIEDILHVPPAVVDVQTHFTDCITSMVGFVGHFSGLLSVHVPQSLALTFTSNMLGMAVEEINDDVNDALGEIANMIGGSFKHHLAKEGHEVRLSTPSVISGKEYMITSGQADETLTLLFDTSEQWFMVSVVLEVE